MDARTEEIRARVEKATPGPWERDDRVLGEGAGVMSTASGLTWEQQRIIDDGSAGGEYSVSTTEENLQFIAHARQDIPYLLTELTALREEVERLKDALEYGFRLVNDRKGEGDFSPAQFVAMAEAALSPPPAQQEEQC